MKSTYKENEIKEARINTNYKQKKISKTLSYSINNEPIQQRDTTSLIPSYIEVNEDSSCISNISTPTQHPTITPNKVDEFMKKLPQ